jgi:hypothetical protein
MSEQPLAPRSHARFWRGLLLFVVIALAVWWLRDSLTLEHTSTAAAVPSSSNALIAKTGPTVAPIITTNEPRAKPGEKAWDGVLPKSAYENVIYEVCGIGKWRLKDGPIPNPLRMTSSDAVVHTVLNELVSGKTEGDRALGLYLKASLAGMAVREEMLRRQPDCYKQEKGVTCINAVGAAEKQAIREASALLIELAKDTKDPAVYAAAMHRCDGMMLESPCDTLKPDRLLMLDAQNGFANLVAANDLARNAVRSRDPVGDAKRAEMLYEKALTMPMFDSRLPAFARILDAPTVREQPVFMINSFTDWLQSERRGIERTAAVEASMNCTLHAVFGISSDAPPVFCPSVNTLRERHPFDLYTYRDTISKLKAKDATNRNIAQLEAELKLLMQTEHELRKGPNWLTCEGMARDNPINAEILRYGHIDAMRRFAAKR